MYVIQTHVQCGALHLPLPIGPDWLHRPGAQHAAAHTRSVRSVGRGTHWFYVPIVSHVRASTRGIAARPRSRCACWQEPSRGSWSLQSGHHSCPALAARPPPSLLSIAAHNGNTHTRTHAKAARPSGRSPPQAPGHYSMASRSRERRRRRGARVNCRTAPSS